MHHSQFSPSVQYTRAHALDFEGNKVYLSFIRCVIILVSQRSYYCCCPSPSSPCVCARVFVLLYALTFSNIHPFSGSCAQVFHPKRIERFNRVKDGKRTGKPRLNPTYTRFTNLRHTTAFDRVLPCPFIIYFFGTKRKTNADCTSIFPIKRWNFIVAEEVSVPKINVSDLTEPTLGETHTLRCIAKH